MRLWPRNWWRRTLGAQLVAITAAAVLMSDVGVAAWFQLGQERASESALTDRLVDRAISASTLLAAIPARQRDAAAHALSSNIWHFQIHRGKALSAPMTDDEAALAARVRALLPKSKYGSAVLVKFQDPQTASPLQNGSQPQSVTDVTIPIVRGTELTTTLNRPPPPAFPTQLLVAAIVAMIATSLAAAFIARRVARPLSELAASASEAARGGAAARVPEEGPDDIRRAAHAFNAMTDQVTRTLERQRQLLSAVGHDLRTPITAMRISAEFIDDSEVRERFQKNLEELQDLTEAVLSAARGAGWEAMRKVDLAALIESVCTDLEELDQPVTWQAHAPAVVMCRPSEIRRAVRNLIENAVAYGKKADVKLAETPQAYEIVVEDDGPGIDDCDLARVFEPFVRLETSRSAETGGSGLGLTLVKAIAEGHGGSIMLEKRAQGGMRARLCLPREAAAA